jgi:hypothetical protein
MPGRTFLMAGALCDSNAKKVCVLCVLVYKKPTGKRLFEYSVIAIQQGARK